MALSENGVKTPTVPVGSEVVVITVGGGKIVNGMLFESTGGAPGLRTVTAAVPGVRHERGRHGRLHVAGIDEGGGRQCRPTALVNPD